MAASFADSGSDPAPPSIECRIGVNSID